MNNCYRCNAELKEVMSDNVDGIRFFECLNCLSGYSQGPGQQLHDRWGMPITLVLYMVIQAADPSKYAKQMILSEDKTISDKKSLIISHIGSELEYPKQKVSEIFDFTCKDEIKLREYLRFVLEGFENEKA